MSNPVQWLEIATTDIERAKKFYSNVFDLQFQFIETPDSKMYMFGEPDKPGCSGALVQSADNTPGMDGTLVYFSCEDVNIQVERVSNEGGKIVIPKTDIGEFGFFAHCIDTEGNRIGLHSDK